MVFHYTIRGGQCKNGSSHINLNSEDITCYVGRDKHENEYLIKYGWPGDIWFHVEGLSSAHVYFRLKNVSWGDSIPLDDLPEDSVYDMMQIVKHNSISGSKLASCKVVWTPHSNLKKTFDMDAGTVTYHNTKLCRYGRCDKDRNRIKELEKTKTERLNVNYYEEMKENERRIIERKKKERKQGTTALYDPIEAAVQAEKKRMNQQGDDKSGLDTGLAALEELGLAQEPDEIVTAPRRGGEGAAPRKKEETSDQPIWMKEAEERLEEASEVIRFLRSRGYTPEEAMSVLDVSSSPVDALARLWRMPMQQDFPLEAADDALDLRREEAEVLKAIFGEGEEGVILASGEDDGSDLFDATLPITSYEPPERYGLPPPLQLEVYVDNDMAPGYPLAPPVLAVVGGGLPEEWLRELTNRLRNKTVETCLEMPGEPQIFALVGYLGEEVEAIIEEEKEEREQERKERAAKARVEAEARRQEAAARQRKELEESGAISKVNKGANYSTEAERRAYAKDVVAATANQAMPAQKAAAPTKRYNTGVSDQQLIQDLFG
eukprot:Nitzschia sp. Nitz4//scaffold1_size375055//179875//181515//NITZ4_000272-RA/size375055-processed-gene-0.360-mRNA-1//1//CDS//3329541033//7637//frame0